MTWQQNERKRFVFFSFLFTHFESFPGNQFETLLTVSNKNTAAKALIPKGYRN